jgi:7-cyano-7-deazaguanine synthase
MSTRCVVLLSGGIDSATTLAIARQEGYDVHALSFDYGQRRTCEILSAKAVASSLGVSRHLIIRSDLRKIGGSALTSAIEVPKSAEPAALLPPQGEQAIPLTYVPARNTIFLSFGLAWAEVLEAPDIFIGANAVDYSGYPDCRPEYLRAFEVMANLATRVSTEGRIRFRILAPLLQMTKGQIIRAGLALGLDYSLTWSCYDPQEISDEASAPISRSGEEEIPSSALSRRSFAPCGRCDSCRIRAKGFREAGLPDPSEGPRPGRRQT